MQSITQTQTHVNSFSCVTAHSDLTLLDSSHLAFISSRRHLSKSEKSRIGDQKREWAESAILKHGLRLQEKILIRALPHLSNEYGVTTASIAAIAEFTKIPHTTLIGSKGLIHRVARKGAIQIVSRGLRVGKTKHTNLISLNGFKYELPDPTSDSLHNLNNSSSSKKNNTLHSNDVCQFADAEEEKEPTVQAKRTYNSETHIKPMALEDRQKPDTEIEVRRACAAYGVEGAEEIEDIVFGMKHDETIQSLAGFLAYALTAMAKGVWNDTGRWRKLRLAQHSAVSVVEIERPVDDGLREFKERMAREDMESKLRWG